MFLHMILFSLAGKRVRLAQRGPVSISLLNLALLWIFCLFL